MLQLDPANITATEFASALDQAKQDNPYRHSGHRLLEEYGRNGSAKSMIDYAMHYIESDHDRYRETDRHINAAVYIALSLGLLGTLLGIFVLFMSGDRHEASDLVGLGIAVVSTMLALVVRLILWPLNIFLQGFVRNKYSLLKEWTVAFAYALAGNRSESYEDNS
ncbi:MAG: MotA/TolQ/ExbB proton channel family protein [Candidatus Poribacteria bacterium]|nr:MotA/TolQ/ExbB proton channel family protein [Candidatus Poribacteria bacterium]